MTPCSRRCYLAADVRAMLGLSKTEFFKKKRTGQLPFLVELLPRIGRPRYRAEDIDAYLRGEYPETARRYFTSSRRKGVA
jgi:hypothetical protein